SDHIFHIIRCTTYDPAWVLVASLIAPFFVVLAINCIVCIIVSNLYKLSWIPKILKIFFKLKNMQRTVLKSHRKATATFYTFMCFCMGLYRLPSIVFYIEV